MRPITIGDKTITRSSAPYIIAEAGINHNGNLDMALAMVKIAHESGCDAIKFQTFKVDEIIVDPNLTYTFKSQGQEITESMIDLFTRYEFQADDWHKIKRQCDTVGISFLSTPQNYSDLQILLELDVDAIKVGSDDFVNIPLIKKYAETDLPLILSSGMADCAEIFTSLNEVGALDGYPVIQMLCVSEYPAPLKNVNLARITSLRNLFPSLVIGYSDHTEGALASSLAIGLGASVIEKHFTIDKDLPGPDHWFSSDPGELASLVTACHSSYEALGSPQLRPSKEEIEMRDLVRRSIVAIDNINKGEHFTEDNIGLRRPGTGLPPAQFNSLLGKTATEDVTNGELIRMQYVSQ
jgi:N,N'-diacetyllegionaminate synthase